jgi:CRP-like cAMP-binding protein/predicted MFS family arabinose efflux permease
MAAAALLAPGLATVADRVRRERVLVGVGLVRAATLGAIAALTVVDGPIVLVYALAVTATIALALFRPAHSALLPGLCTSPQQLTRANAVRGTLDSGATLVGPAIAALLMALAGPAAAFAACAVASLVGALAVVGLAYDAPPRSVGARADGFLAGFRIIAGHRGLALITGLGFVQTFTRGCLAVLTVAVAIDLLGTGDPGVGVLSAAVGAGGMLGSLLAFRLVGRGRLASWFGLGVALFGAPLVLIGGIAEQAPTLVLLGVVGMGNALIDVAGFTLLGRLSDETVLARMFAGFEAVLTFGVAAGSLVTPVIIDGLGLRTTLVAIGLLAPLAVVLARPALRRLDADMLVRDADVELLRVIPMLSGLPVATIEQLASALERTGVEPGQPVFRQGEPGEFFYVVRAGRAEVLQDGHLVKELGAGDCFGEIALLRDQPRSATVRGAGGARLEVSRLRRGAFLTAVTGYPAAAVSAEELVRRRLQADAARLRPAEAPSGREDGAAPAPEPEHVGDPPARDVDGPPKPLEQAGVRQPGG